MNGLEQASPQPENGHLDIANELVEVFAKTNLSEYEWRMVWALWRKTWAWHKKEDQISVTQFEKLTGLDRRNIVRTLKKLIQKRIIAKKGNGRKLSYRFQKDYLRWILSPETTQSLSPETIERIVVPKDNISLSVETTQSLSPETNTKEKKETFKRKGKPFSSQSPKEEIPNPHPSVLSKNGMMQWIEHKDGKIELKPGRKGEPYFVPYQGRN